MKPLYITEFYKPLVTVDFIKIKNEPFTCLNPDEIAEQLVEKGHATLFLNKPGKIYNEPSCLINFFTFLKSHPNEKFYLVGHCDNKMPQKEALKISIENARFIKQILVSKYKINPGQIQIKGLGYLCPLTSNKVENGKLNNRLEWILNTDK